MPSNDNVPPDSFDRFDNYRIVKGHARKNRNGSRALQQHRCDRPHESIDQSGRDQICGSRWTALAQHAVDLTLAESSHREREVEPVAAFFADKDHLCDLR